MKLANKIYSLVCLTLLVLPGAAFAGGALKTNINGMPFAWEPTVVYNLEQGALKNGVYDAAASRELIDEAFATWNNVAGVDLNIIEGELLPDGGDTTVHNYQNFYQTGAWECYDEDPSTPCHNPIIFDEDGSIIEKMFGECAQFSILGYAGFMDVAGSSGDPALTTLKRGQAVFSGACIEPVATKSGCGPCKKILDQEEVKTLILHELGHFLGMGHAQVNPDSYAACSGQMACSEELAEHIPTMFPLLVRGAKQLTLHRDDQAHFQKMYGDPEQNTCSVSGTVFAQDGKTPLRGVEVVARNTNPDLAYTDAIAFVSGHEAPRVTVSDKNQDNCVENCGDYEITGLAPGETYQLCVQRVLEKFTGSKRVGPVEPTFQDVDNVCPEAITVTCQCSGDTCPTYRDRNITTTNDGLDSPALFSQNEITAASGGCSLIAQAVSSSRSFMVYGWSVLFLSGLFTYRSFLARWRKRKFGAVQ